MPKVTGKPRKLRKAIQQYKVSFVLAQKPTFLRPVGSGINISLPFNMQRQTQSYWCWAATSTSISLFYNALSKWTQCLVAKRALGKECCNNPFGCNITWYLDRALQITANFVSVSGALNQLAIQSQLQLCRIIGTRIGWVGGGGHFMAIYGCSDRTGIFFLSIDDPIYGKSDLSLIDYSRNYKGSGSWTHSYYTKA
jgi:hypothetical protein